MPTGLHHNPHFFSAHLDLAVELLRFLAVPQFPFVQFPRVRIDKRSLLEARVIVTTYNDHVRLLSPEPWLASATKVYSGVGADIVMESLHSLTAIYEMTSRLSTVLLGVAGVDLPAALVILLSLLIGLLMVVVFRYTSDQKAIRLAKDQLKAHLLAVRLFHDQLPVVLSSYGRILRCTGHSLRLPFKPLLFVVLPLTFLIVQLDRYLVWSPLQYGHASLVKVRTTSPEALNEA